MATGTASATARCCRFAARSTRARLDSALEFTFVLERIAPGICRFRVAGRHLCELMGLDVAGMPISAMFTVDARVQIGQIVENVCAEP